MKDKLLNILKAKTPEEVDKASREFMSNVGTDQISLKRAKVRKVRKVRKANDEYVYDVGMKNKNHPWFFANNILVHNSVYFSAYPAYKEQIEAGELEWNKEKAVELYDEISSMVSDTFPQFMLDAFNVPYARSEGVIAAGREIVASTGLFIKKKRYAAMVYDNEGERKDVDGKPGKMKAMGLDLRRADTPVFVQEFLSKVLTMVLTEHTEEECIQFIKEFKELYDDMAPWEKGTPKAVNGVTKYMNKIEERNKQIARGQTPKTLMVPGHVQGSFNWNLLRERHNDLHRAKITDGSKVILCYLKDNDYKFKNIAYPVEENHLPDWFLELPFDEERMMESGVDKKIENMLGVMKWDLSKASKQADHFGSLFEF
jgi:hypothetical protein